MMVTEILLSRHESEDEAIFSLEYIIIHSAQQPWTSDTGI